MLRMTFVQVFAIATQSRRVLKEGLERLEQ